MNETVRNAWEMGTASRQAPVEDNDWHRTIDLKTLRRMLMAYSISAVEWNRPKLPVVNSTINELLTTYRDLRKLRRERHDPCSQKGGFAMREAGRIKVAMRELVNSHDFDVGGTEVKGNTTGWAKYTKGRKGRRSENASVDFTVGYMWHRNVYEKIHKGKRLQSHVVLAATEYRTNVQHVRLYEVRAYSVAGRAMVAGWVGQTKIGRQLCAFQKERAAAISAGLKLTTQEIDYQINGEKQ